MAEHNQKTPQTHVTTDLPYTTIDTFEEFFETIQTATAEPLSFGKIARNRLKKDKLTLAAISMILFLVFSAVFANVISTHILKVKPDSTDLMATFELPSKEHLLGTDQLGRDQLARLLFGGRVSLAIAFSGSFLAMTIGVFFGLVSGFFGGLADDVMMWFVNTMQSIPTLFLLLIIVAVFSPSAFWLTMIFGFLGWFGITRLVRGEVFSVRERDYVLAAKALGASDYYTLFRHILPNIIPIVIVIAARDIGILILSESGLSFLGLGVQPPTATWGNMLSKSQQYFVLGPHLVVFPGVLITITVLCLYLIGDGLRDALDPRLK